MDEQNKRMVVPRYKNGKPNPLSPFWYSSAVKGQKDMDKITKTANLEPTTGAAIKNTYMDLFMANNPRLGNFIQSRQLRQLQQKLQEAQKVQAPVSSTPATTKTAKIDPMTVARYGVGGAAVGGSLAAVISLAHAINLSRRQQKEMKPVNETDENTIVLTLPHGKIAEVKMEDGMPVAVKSKESPTTSNKKVPAKSYRAGFYPNQEMKRAAKDWASAESFKDLYTIPEEGEDGWTKDLARKAFLPGYPVVGAYQAWRRKLKRGKKDGAKHEGEKAANWQTLTASVLAATGGGMLGYHIINKAYQASLQRKLKAQEVAARQEMLDRMLVSGQKTGCAWLDSNFIIPLDKSAQLQERSNFTYLDAPMAMAALMTLLGIGGTGYITKKILDNKIKTQEKEFKPPRVQRIVFKSAKDKLEDGEALASPEDLESIKCALAIVMDQISGRMEILSGKDMQSELIKAGTTADEMYKWAQMDANPLVAILQSAPELRRMLQKRYMQSNPTLRHFTPLLKVPGLNNLADKLTYDKVRAQTDTMFGAAPKVAGMMGGMLTPSIIGSMIAEGVMPDAPNPPVQDKALPANDEVEAEKIQEYLNNIQLSAKDPRAAEYLIANQDAIRALLGRMAATGTLAPKAAQVPTPQLPQQPKAQTLQQPQVPQQRGPSNVTGVPYALRKFRAERAGQAVADKLQLTPLP